MYEVFQARILEWGAILPGQWLEPECLVSPALAGGFFTTSATWETQENNYTLFAPNVEYKLYPVVYYILI